MTNPNLPHSRQLLAVADGQGGACDAACHSPWGCSSPVPTHGEWCPSCIRELELERGLRRHIAQHYREQARG